VSTFTPDDEPYLGRPLLHHFDLVIVTALEQSAGAGPLLNWLVAAL
jgi:hypothetical protein